MLEEIKKLSFFMGTFILIVFALLPLFSMVEGNLEYDDSFYYEQYN